MSSDEEEIIIRRKTKPIIFDEDFPAKGEYETNSGIDNIYENEVSNSQSYQPETKISQQPESTRDSDSETEIAINKRHKKHRRIKNSSDESDTEASQLSLQLDKEKLHCSVQGHNTNQEELESSQNEEEIDESRNEGPLQCFDKEQNKDNDCPSPKNRFRDSDLYDAEGSSDEEGRDPQEVVVLPHDMPRNESDTSSRDKPKKKKENKKTAKKPGKTKETPLDEIRSETQRMIRESNVSLPYHRPKQRTLADFLNRKHSSPIVPLKTTKDKLSVVWEHLEKMEKTVGKLYKSESEDEGEILPKVDIELRKKSPEKGHCPEVKDVEPERSNENLVGSVAMENDKEKSLVEKDGLPMSTLEKSENLSNALCSVQEEASIDTTEVVKSSIECEIENETGIVKLNSIEITDSEKMELTKEMSEEKNDSTEQDLVVDTPKNQSTTLESSLFDIQLDITPKITGSPDCIIDFDEQTTKPGALGLIKRFIKHAALKGKKPAIVSSKLSIVKADCNEEGEIVCLSEETINLKNETPKPGEKLMALKASLQQSIAVNREQQWAKRIQEYKLNEEEIFEDDKEKDFEEEAVEMTESESETEEEEDEDDDGLEEKPEKSKPRHKSAFVDEEAEVSEDEISGDEASANEGEDEDEEEEKDGSEKDCNSESEEESVEEEEVPKRNELTLSNEEESSLGIGKLDNSLTRGNESIVSDSDLMNLCSGKFSSQPLKLTDFESSKEASQFTETMDMKLIYPEDSVTQDIFHAKMDSHRIESSDDEEMVPRKVTKRKLVLQISDDEEEDEGGGKMIATNLDSDEENIGDIRIEEAKDGYSDEEAEDEEVVEDEEMEEENATPARFFEAEAELSGSDWDSADEDEQDLDNFEKELGDDEHIDERKLQKELGRIHARALRAEDDKEVKILQELLLEDGELHSDGPKRQRLYRWANAGDDDMKDKVFDDIDGVGEEEEEEEEVWRRERHQRETYLKNKKIDNTEVGIDEKDLEAICVPKREVKPTPPPTRPETLITSPDPKRPFNLLTKRGSFLARGENILSRLAEITSGAKDQLGKSRGQRGMVFAVVSPPKEFPEKEETNVKRKADGLITPLAKKLKFSKGVNPVKRGSILQQLRQSDINVS